MASNGTSGASFETHHNLKHSREADILALYDQKRQKDVDQLVLQVLDAANRNADDAQQTISAVARSRPAALASPRITTRAISLLGG
eukprot:520672-Amorphochlora_amoeboformis.AAC.2